MTGVRCNLFLAGSLTDTTHLQQQLKTAFAFAFATCCTQLIPRLGIKFGQQKCGHLINQSIDGRATTLCQGFQAAVFFVR